MYRCPPSVVLICANLARVGATSTNVGPPMLADVGPMLAKLGPIWPTSGPRMLHEGPPANHSAEPGKWAKSRRFRCKLGDRRTPKKGCTLGQHRSKLADRCVESKSRSGETGHAQERHLRKSSIAQDVWEGVTAHSRQSTSRHQDFGPLRRSQPYTSNIHTDGGSVHERSACGAAPTGAHWRSRSTPRPTSRRPRRRAS